MLKKGRIKRVFPGNNTSEGFYSLYENIIGPEANRVFIMKGGPGVGKSTLMKDVGMAMLEMGYDVEFHHCSSDNASLDGVVILSIGVALIDGTAPHILDPRYPGAVDEIVHLGDFWDEGKLVAKKEEIIRYNKRIGRYFRTAYSYLKEAKVAQDELRSYHEEMVDRYEVNKLCREVVCEVFEEHNPQHSKTGSIRRLFASANTPAGLINYIETILQDIGKLFIIKGEPGSGGDQIMQTVFKQGDLLGVECQAYHCPFEPALLELLVFPKLNVAVLRENEHLNFDPGLVQGLNSIEVLNLNKYLDVVTCEAYQEEIQSAKERINGNLRRAWASINKAKAIHDEIEIPYIEAMDFDAVGRKKGELLKRILDYAGK